MRLLGHVVAVLVIDILPSLVRCLFKSRWSKLRPLEVEPATGMIQRFPRRQEKMNLQYRVLVVDVGGEGGQIRIVIWGSSNAIARSLQDSYVYLPICC